MTKEPKKNKTGVKVEIILEQREVAFKICENMKFSREIQSSQILLGDKNTTSLCSKNISTLTECFDCYLKREEAIWPYCACLRPSKA